MNVCAVIGRFSIFHNGHAALLRTALEDADRVVIVIGSAFHARTPKNPFTWEERADMIRISQPAADRDRLRFVPVRDYYDDERWAAAVRSAVQKEAPEATRVRLVGHAKDHSSRYLAWFPGWELVDVAMREVIDAKDLRAIYLEARPAPDSIDAALAVIGRRAPAPVVEFLRAWAKLPEYARIRDEHAELAAGRAQWASAPYPPIFSTVDAIVEACDHILLIRRGRAPGKGLLAVPGGFVDPDERLLDAAIRELREETGMGFFPDDLRACLRGVKVFDHPDRSQRGRTITHAHHFALPVAKLPEIKAGDDAAEAAWTAKSSLSGLEDQFHDDHFHILDEFLKLT